MAITEAFKNDVAANNVKGIRIMMKNSMLVEPSFTEFNEMSEYAKNVHGLYDVHDGKTFVQDSSQWNDSYMNKTMVELIGNFSKERIEHLKKVVRYLKPVKTNVRTSTTTDNNKSATQTNHSYYEQKKIDNEKGIIISRGTKIASGAVVGGAVGGTVAGVVGSSIIGGIATGAVVVGAVVAIMTRGE